MATTTASKSKPKRVTYRIQQIPGDWTKDDLKSAFCGEDKPHVEVKSLVPDVMNYGGDARETDTLTATIRFSPPEPREPRFEEEYEDELVIDKDFIGFTPLNKPENECIADIIAITGLAGHAYGSWRHKSDKMWLRDFLPKTFPQVRVMTYGYEAQVQGTVQATSIVADHGESFGDDLLTIRDFQACQDRPLILIGHSLGGLIIKEFITNLTDDVRSRLPLRSVLFFGVPHRGLETNGSLNTMVKGQPSQTIVDELQRDSPTLLRLDREFSKATQKSQFSIHSFYENQQTKTVIQNAAGEWVRGGPSVMMVPQSSAALNNSKDGHARQIRGDHSSMVKMDKGQDGCYHFVVKCITEDLKNATEVSSSRRKNTCSGDELDGRVQQNAVDSSTKSPTMESSDLDSLGKRVAETLNIQQSNETTTVSPGEQPVTQPAASAPKTWRSYCSTSNPAGSLKCSLCQQDAPQQCFRCLLCPNIAFGKSCFLQSAAIHDTSHKCYKIKDSFVVNGSAFIPSPLSGIDIKEERKLVPNKPFRFLINNIPPGRYMARLNIASRLIQNSSMHSKLDIHVWVGQPRQVEAFMEGFPTAQIALDAVNLATQLNALFTWHMAFPRSDLIVSSSTGGINVFQPAVGSITTAGEDGLFGIYILACPTNPMGPICTEHVVDSLRLETFDEDIGAITSAELNSRSSENQLLTQILGPMLGLDQNSTITIGRGSESDDSSDDDSDDDDDEQDVQGDVSGGGFPSASSTFVQSSVQYPVQQFVVPNQGFAYAPQQQPAYYQPYQPYQQTYYPFYG